MPTTDDVWRTDTFSCWRCQRARHSMGSAQNYPGPTGLQRSVCILGAKESHRWWQSSLFGNVWAFLVSFGHVTLIKESCFGAETWLLHKTWNQKNDVWKRNCHLPPAKKMEALSSVKMTVEICLGTINTCFFWISLAMVTLCADCYCGTLSLQRPFFASGIGYFAKVLSFCTKMPGVIHPTGLTAFYGCTSDRLRIIPNLALSVLSLTESLRSTWLASDWNRCWCEASYHLLATDTFFTLEYIPWYHCQANAEMVVVTTLKSEVYHLLHTYHVLIKVTITFWHESVC